MNKKIIASITGVLAYIDFEKELILETKNDLLKQENEQAASLESLNLPSFKPWTVSGIQSQMQMRNLMQMKAFHRKF